MIQLVQINELFGNKKLVKLLIFLVENSSKELSYTFIRKKTKLAKATLTKWLNYLLKINFIFVRSVGTTKLYKLNKENYLIKQLKIMINLNKLSFFVNLSRRYNFEAYLFGSAARGEDDLV